jgi:ectoine hydroxylase-related dioxygenase (phytanoyl-CoA dioxygenase family)
MSLSENNKRCLDQAGYVVLPDFIQPDLLAQLRSRIASLFTEEGDQAGNEFKQEPGCRRLANLVNKGEEFRAAICEPRLLEYIRHVLGPEIKLSSLNARSVNAPGAGAQPLHVDMAAIPDDRGYWVCNSLWMLDDFTPENGTLRVIPGSHRWRRLPQDTLTDPFASHPGEVLVTGKAGTVVIVNAHLWHGGTANRSGASRTALHAFFCRRDKPQQQYQKRLLDPKLQMTLSPRLRGLLAIDDPENDRLSADVAIRSGFLK